MLDFGIRTIDVFHNPMENDYLTPFATLAFSVSPPDYIQWNENRAARPGPCLVLIPATVRLRDRYTGTRTNWAAVLETEDVRVSAQPGMVELHSRSECVRVPWLVTVEPALVSSMEMEWEQACSTHRGGLPGDRLRARMAIVCLLKRFLDHQRPLPDTDPSAKLKHLIDEDPKQEQDIGALSRQCDYSADHLRTLFKRSYGLAPHLYRNRRRMSLAMEMITGSRLSIKDVGVRVGARHMSHFTSMFRKEFGMTPSEAVQKFRRCG